MATIIKLPRQKKGKSAMLKEIKKYDMPGRNPEVVDAVMIEVLPMDDRQMEFPFNRNGSFFICRCFFGKPGPFLRREKRVYHFTCR